MSRGVTRHTGAMTNPERDPSEVALCPGSTDCDVEVLGPAPAYIVRRGGKWRFHVVLRGDRPLDVLGEDPGVPWSVDVEPESLL